MQNFIPVNTPCLNGNEKKYLNECIDTGWISSEGPFVSQFEAAFSNQVDRKYGISVCNGTVALQLAFEALELGEHDEVIMPSFSIISCVLACIRCGAKPVFVDVNPKTWNMDLDEVARKINARTKAILAVHTYGLPVEMDPLLEIAAKHQLHIIEDAAEMHGQTYHGKKCGSFGALSVFSFYPNKLITTGEGGMIVTDDEALAEKLKSLRNLGFGRTNRYQHELMGHNFRFTNLQAAVGLAQLERWDEFIDKKRQIGIKYQTAFADIEDLQLPIAETDYAQNIYWVFGMVYPKVEASQLMQALQALGIGTRAFFYPLHMQPVLLENGYVQKQHLKNSEYLCQHGLYIPSGLGLSPQEQTRVIEAVHTVLGKL